MLSALETSTLVPKALPEYEEVRRSLVALTSASVREQKWTMAPSSRKDLTIARPMPLVPPAWHVSDSLLCYIV